MAKAAKRLDSNMNIIQEDDYLIVEHPILGHIVELHLDDFETHEELLKEEYNRASIPPWN